MSAPFARDQRGTAEYVLDQVRDALDHGVLEFQTADGSYREPYLGTHNHLLGAHLEDSSGQDDTLKLVFDISIESTMSHLRLVVREPPTFSRVIEESAYELSGPVEDWIVQAILLWIEEVVTLHLLGDPTEVDLTSEFIDD